MPKTAILIFSRYAVEESKAKGYAAYIGKKGGSALAAHLIDYTIRESKETGLPVFTYFSNIQVGNSFGERLANSVEDVYAKGFSNVIVLGTDSPSINCAVIASVASELLSNEIVLGPAKDGGVYVIGINQKAYDRNSFISLPWLTSSVFTSLVQYASTAKSSLFVETIGEDFDEVSSMLEWKSANSYNPISLVFDAIIAVYKSYKYNVSFSSYYLYNTPGTINFRGPPSYTSL